MHPESSLSHASADPRRPLPALRTFVHGSALPLLCTMFAMFVIALAAIIIVATDTPMTALATVLR
jgi:hypothetical protein